MKDELGDHFKGIERCWRTTIPADSFMIIRVDGRAFHTWTRGLERPFDPTLTTVMNETAEALCREVSNPLCAYVQSDEISLITTDLASPGTEHWFGGVVQKVASISSAIATSRFNTYWRAAHQGPVIYPDALFDARVFMLTSVSEVADYLWWRQTDARRNAISMLAHHHLGKKAVDHMGTRDRVEALKAAGVDPDEVDRRFMNGGLTLPHEEPGSTTYFHKKLQKNITTDFTRTVWRTAPEDRIRNWFYQTHLERFEGT